MCFTTPLANQPFVTHLSDGETLVSLPGDNLELLGASAGSSIIEAVPGYDWPAHAQIEAWWRVSAQTMLLPDFPPSESLTRGTGGYLPIQSATEYQGIHAIDSESDGKARPVCVYCSKDFGRVQELERHVKDKHMPRRRCPWCDFVWTRPCKIKFHLLSNHAERFTAEVLEGIKALCGRRLVEFVNAYDHGNDVEAISQPVAVVQDPLSHSDPPARGTPLTGHWQTDVISLLPTP